MHVCGRPNSGLAFAIRCAKALPKLAVSIGQSTGRLGNWSVTHSFDDPDLNSLGLVFSSPAHRALGLAFVNSGCSNNNKAKRCLIDASSLDVNYAKK